MFRVMEKVLVVFWGIMFKGMLVLMRVVVMLDMVLLLLEVMIKLFFFLFDCLLVCLICLIIFLVWLVMLILVLVKVILRLIFDCKCFLIKFSFCFILFWFVMGLKIRWLVLVLFNSLIIVLVVVKLIVRGMLYIL